MMHPEIPDGHVEARPVRVEAIGTSSRRRPAMTKTALVGISAIVLVTASAAIARAKDISAKKVSIKGATDPAKRQIQVQSVDTGVLLSEADDPGANGASIHVYSATDDFCATLPP